MNVHLPVEPPARVLLALLCLMAWAAVGCGAPWGPNYAPYYDDSDEADPPPARVPLTVPFPLTLGGTAVPAHGTAGGFEGTRGTTGQEVDGAWAGGLSLGGGIDNRVGGAVRGFNIKKPRGSSYDLPGGPSWSWWGRVGGLLGADTSTKAMVTVTYANRTEPGLQAERLRALDVVVPTEFLLRESGTSRRVRRFSLYAGPRFLRARYLDDLDPTQNLRADFYGAVLGLHFTHLSFGLGTHGLGTHVFAEATIVKIPPTVYRGATYGNRVTLVPAFGLVWELGRPHRWE